MEKLAFGRGEHARALRVFVDEETVNDSREAEVLLAFSHHEQVEVIGTDDRFPNKIRIGAYDPLRGFAPCETEFANGRYRRSGAHYQPALARQLAPPGEADQAERVVALAAAAAEHGADALVPTSPVLLGRQAGRRVQAADPMSPGEAVALLGLFLRVREDFVIDLGAEWRYNFDRALFYWVLLRDLTPSGWRWFSACVTHARYISDDTSLFAGQSVFERIERALRARDRLHEKLQLPESRDAATEAIFYFDVALFMLGGAFDGLARVADIVHQLPGSPRAAGWGSRTWMRNLKTVNPTLATMMTREQPHRDAREMVALLRNTIHQEILRTITWRSQGTRSERVIVPVGIADELEEAVARAGSPGSFGLSPGLDGSLYIDPGIYIESILPLLFAAMNALMDATPVENLAGVIASHLPSGPPEDDDTFSPTIRERIRLLGGVG